MKICVCEREGNKIQEKQEVPNTVAHHTFTDVWTVPGQQLATLDNIPQFIG